MRAAVVPRSASSQLYNFGNSTSTEAAQGMMMMPCLENSIPMDSIRFQNLEVEAASFCWDSIAFSDYQLDHPQTPALGFNITPPQPSFFTSYDQQISAGSEYVSFCSSSDTISSQSSTPLVVENVIHSRQVGKRLTEVSNSSIAMKGGKRKRSSDTFAAETLHHHHQQQQMDDQSITLQEIKVNCLSIFMAGEW
ncbi:hypothetical protein LINPERHAP1_LOCUS2942 [Linum perenne]